MKYMTKRQLEVEALLYGGMSGKQIAYALGITHRTYKSHSSEVYKFYKVTDRVELMSMKIEELGTDEKSTIDI